MAEVGGGGCWGGQMFGWIDGVLMPLGSRRILWRLHDTARKIGRSGEPWCRCRHLSFAWPILLGSCVPCLVPVVPISFN